MQGVEDSPLGLPYAAENSPFTKPTDQSPWASAFVLMNQPSPATAQIERTDANGGLALAEVMANLGGLLDVVWFTNNLPYAERIEYDGWSRQAPEGMVRKHVAQWRRIVEAKARALGR